MDDVDTRDKYEPHYGMSNLNSRQEERRRKTKTENILLQEEKKNEGENKKHNSRRSLRLRRRIRQIC